MTQTDVLAFEDYVRANQRFVYRIAYGLTRNREDAEDVAQDAFVQAQRKFGTIHDASAFRAWVTTIARRLSLNRIRAESRQRRRENAWALAQAPQTTNAEASAADRDALLRLHAELERLPEKLRAVLVLSAIDGLDTRAVAESLGIPEGTVRSRLHAARKTLARTLGVLALLTVALLPSLHPKPSGDSLHALSTWRSPTASLLVVHAKTGRTHAS